MGTPLEIRVFVVDAHPVTAEGLRHLLSLADDVVVIGAISEVPDVDAVIAQMTALRPDVVVMDPFAPGVSSEEAIRLVKEVFPISRVLVFSSHDDVKDIIATQVAGASGYLHSTATGDMILNAIHLIQAGGTLLDWAMAEKLLQYIVSLQSGVDLETKPCLSLTTRETSVMRLVTMGLSNAQIAEELSISARTVKAHLTSIYTKMGCYGRYDMIAKVLKGGAKA